MEHHALCIILEWSKPHDHVNFLNFSNAMSYCFRDEEAMKIALKCFVLLLIL